MRPVDETATPLMTVSECATGVITAAVIRGALPTG